ncbi:NUDIX hydrolase [Solibacillus sp. FSL K6-1523]|uniref:NUDIX hydrolase n=1 Tax=Solibacillus sp. FSL K6-1523 TaxID=2921471 RepID=UPI0030F50C59
MNLHDQITLYEPYNEQEKKDRELILRAMDTSVDVLTRNNEILHFTASAFVFNRARTHVLMVYHNIYQSWSWTGGHADGESDLLKVARQEVMEETGVSKVNVLTEQMISLDILTVIGHVKNGSYVAPHLHLNATYVFEVADDESLRAKPGENSAVGWIQVDELAEKCAEKHMVPLYEKIIRKVKELEL